MNNPVQNQFLDYISWRKTNTKLINYLKAASSAIYDRFSCIIVVLDYLYDKSVNQKSNLSTDEDDIFEIGYAYLFKCFDTLNLIAEHVFNNDYLELNSFANEILLLFDATTFNEDLELYDGDYQKEHQILFDIEQEILAAIESKTHLTDEIFTRLDRASNSIFSAIDHNYITLVDIFYDIAADLDLISDEI